MYVETFGANRREWEGRAGCWNEGKGAGGQGGKGKGGKIGVFGPIY